MKIELEHFFLQCMEPNGERKASPAYHISIVETPETIEEWKASKGVQARVVNMAEALALGFDFGAIVKGLNAQVTAQAIQLADDNRVLSKGLIDLKATHDDFVAASQKSSADMLGLLQAERAAHDETKAALAETLKVPAPLDVSK